MKTAIEHMDAPELAQFPDWMRQSVAINREASDLHDAGLLDETRFVELLGDLCRVTPPGKHTLFISMLLRMAPPEFALDD
jgi:hypothetical protein